MGDLLSCRMFWHHRFKKSHTNQPSKMIFIRLLSLNKTNCDDLRWEFLYEILNWHYLCAFLTSGSGGILPGAGFLPDLEKTPDSGRSRAPAQP